MSRKFIIEPVALLELRDPGLYCPAGDFYIDPAAPVDRAVITHAHSDHVCRDSRAYLTAAPGEALLRDHLGAEASIQAANYGEPLTLGSVRVSFHPAGHILGSAQIRIEQGGEVWVVSGDYKLEPDLTCEPFEPVRCHTFVTEATFALPIFRWPAETETLDSIHAWWRANQESGKPSLLFINPLGKAQRLLAHIDPAIGPVHAHESIERFNAMYRTRGVALAPSNETADWRRALILAPPSARGTPWTRPFGAASTALASGWMRIRGTRRRRSLDRGFVLSDHADWPALLRVIDDTGAATIWATHGYTAPLVRWLHEQGREALAFPVPLAEAAS
jgi:putative mRNA 3-end processing factor